MPKIDPYLIAKVKAAVDDSSFEEVGEFTKVGRSGIWYICNGRTHCRKTTLDKLIAKFGVPPGDSSGRLSAGQAEETFPGANLPPHLFLLRVDYPEEQFETQLQRSEKLRMTGTNLRRHDSRRAMIGKFLYGGGSIEALVVDLQSPARKYAAFQEHGDIEPASIATFSEHVKSSRDWLCGLKTQENNKYYENVQIKKIAYPLCYGLDAMEFRGGGGVIYVRFYPLMNDPTEKDRPIIEIGDDNEEWYRFFTAQVERHFSRGKPLHCPKELKKGRR